MAGDSCAEWSSAEPFTLRWRCALWPDTSEGGRDCCGNTGSISGGRDSSGDRWLAECPARCPPASRGGMGGGGELSRGGRGGVGLGGSGGGLPEEEARAAAVLAAGTCGRMTGILSASCRPAPASLSLGLVWKLGVTGVLAGDCLNTATGEPKLGLASGDTSSLLRLPILGSGLGWFLPRRSFGRIPGDLRLRPGHRRSQLRRLRVSELRGSISTERDHR